jgi:hypothetical protein
MGFRDLFHLAKKRHWTAAEEQAFAALSQEARNRAVKALAAEAGCVQTEDRLGCDGVVYTAFWLARESTNRAALQD